MLYIISPGFIYLITGICTIWLPLPPPSTPHLRQLLIWLLYLWTWFFVFHFFHIPHISKIIRWLSFPVWLISLSIMPQGPFLSHPYWGNWDLERLSGLCKDIAGTQRVRDSGGLTSEASVSATVLPPEVSPQPASEMLCWKVNWTRRWETRLDTLVPPALILALPLFSWMTFGKLQYLFFLLPYQEKSCLLVSVYTMRLFWKLTDILHIKYCIQCPAYNKY